MAAIDSVFDLSGAGFVLIAAGEKFPPIEKSWQERPHAFQEAGAHVAAGGNVGLMAGPGQLGGLDQDDPQAFAGLELPKTLTWQTRPGRLGMLFRWSDDRTAALASIGKKPNLAQLKLFKDGQPCGEVKLERTYQVIPPSWKEIDGQRVDYRLLETSAPAEISLAWLIGELQRLGITFSQKERSRLDSNVAKLDRMAKEARQKKVGGDEARNRRYAEAALAGEVEAVRFAPVGNRNNQLNISATKLGGWASAGVLTAVEIERKLAEAAMDAGLEPSEIAATIKSGLKAGMRSPREIPEDHRSQRPSTIKKAELDLDIEEMTEGGNASRLIRLRGQDMRYVHDRGKWLIWEDGRWECDTNGRALREAETVVSYLYVLAGIAGDSKEREKLACFAKSCDKILHLRNVLAIASHREGIAITSQALDRDPWLIGVGPLIIEAKTGTVNVARREDLITKKLGTEYRPGVSCPLWLAFLDRIFDKDQELISYIKRAVGYSLTGSMEEQVFFFCHGTGHNGKSVFLETIRALVGDYGAAASFETFLIQRNQNIRNDLAALAGKRFITAKEAEEGSKFSMAVLKSWTGGDEVTARFLHAEYFSFHPEGKIWLAANSKPTISERNLAAWRRVHLIPFNVTIPAAERDKGLTDKLKAELPGILNWALEGLAEYLEIGLKPPEAVKAATDQYRRENDSLQAFIGECCHVDKLASCRNAVLYPAYERFCKDGGYHPLTQTAFSRELESAPGISKKHTNRGRVWNGISLADHTGEGFENPESLARDQFGEGGEGYEGQSDVFLLMAPREEKIADLPSYPSPPALNVPHDGDSCQMEPFTTSPPGGQEMGLADQSLVEFKSQVAAHQQECCHKCGTLLAGIGGREDPETRKWYCMPCWQADHPPVRCDWCGKSWNIVTEKDTLGNVTHYCPKCYNDRVGGKQSQL